MAAVSTYLELEWLKSLNGTTFTGISTCYVKLHTGYPGEAGTLEAASETDREIATWQTPSGDTLTNNDAIQWLSVAGTETYTHVSVWDNATAGNCLLVGTMSSSVAVTAGDDFEFAAGNFTVKLD